MQPQNFQAQKPQMQQGQTMQMQAPQGKNLLSSLAGLGMGIATGNPMMALNGGLGALGVGGGGGGGGAQSAGGGEAGTDPKAAKPKGDKPKTAGEAPEEAGVSDVYQPMGQMLDPMSLLTGMLMIAPQMGAYNQMQQQAMQPQMGFGGMSMQQQQPPPQQWGNPGQFWTGGW